MTGGDDILIGGINKVSDAVYVRELHQITCMKYNIGIASEAQTPSGMKGKQVFHPGVEGKGLGPVAAGAAHQRQCRLDPYLEFQRVESNPGRFAHLDPGSPAQAVRQSRRRVEAEAVLEH